MNKVIVLNGNTWSQAGNGIQVSGTVNTLISYQNKLYAAGKLGPNTDPHKIYKMDGNVWTQVEIIEGDVYSSIVFDNKLYLGGMLQNINSVPLKNIAYFSNNLWRKAGDGLNSSPYSLCTFPNSVSQDELYAGGGFSSTGSGTSANRVAKLCPCDLSVNITAQNTSSGSANDGSASATVINPNGSYIYHWSNGATTQTVTGLAAGTYFVTVDDGNGCSVADSAVVSMALQSGAVCTVATLLPSANGLATDTVFQITGMEYWMKFTADTTAFRIAIQNPTDSLSADIRKLILYSGDCGTLQEKISRNKDAGENLEIVSNDLETGSIYFIKAEQPEAVVGNFSFDMEKIKPGSSCLFPLEYVSDFTNISNSYTLTDSVLWVKFLADTLSMRVNINNQNNISKVSLFTSCNASSFIKSTNDTLSIYYKNFIPNNYYYLKIMGQRNAVFNLSVSRSPNEANPPMPNFHCSYFECSQYPFNFVTNGSFEQSVFYSDFDPPTAINGMLAPSEVGIYPSGWHANNGFIGNPVDGNYLLICDAKTDIDKRIWYENIVGLIPGQKYYFNFYIRNMNPDIYANNNYSIARFSVKLKNTLGTSIFYTGTPLPRENHPNHPTWVRVCGD